VGLGCPGRYAEVLTNLGVGTTSRDEFDNLALASGEVRF